MPTTTGHTRAIRASKVTGTSVYNAEGDSIGKLEDVVLDKLSNRIMFAVVGVGGILGMGEKYHAIPWSVLNYDEAKDGYLIPFSTDVLKGAPSYSVEELTRDDGDVRTNAYAYYKVAADW